MGWVKSVILRTIFVTLESTKAVSLRSSQTSPKSRQRLRGVDDEDGPCEVAGFQEALDTATWQKYVHFDLILRHVSEVH